MSAALFDPFVITKRALEILAALILLLVVAAAILLAPALFLRRSVPDRLQIAGIHIVKDGMVSVGVIPIAPGEVALIDAGNDASGQAVLDELSRQKLGPDAVTAIFVTHDGSLKGAPWIFSDSQAEDRASLVQLADRLDKDNVAVDAIVFAHSGALTEGRAPLTTFARNQR